MRAFNGRPKKIRIPDEPLTDAELAARHARIEAVLREVGLL
jgi:hypothetical protein